jgi:hypothetical protein
MAEYDVDDEGQFVFFKVTPEQWNKKVNGYFYWGMVCGAALGIGAMILLALYL